MTKATILSIRRLRLVFETMRGRVQALSGVDLEIKEGEVVGLVGESGCGKSSLALSTIGLLPVPPARIIGGSEVFFKGQNLLLLKEDQMEKVRGSGIAMVFQEPLTSLDPLFTIGDQLEESVRIGLEHRGQTGTLHARMDEKADGDAASWLRRVGLPDPKGSLEKYPHELSGGMRQRVMIAMAMAAKPSLILADEPTSALDVTTQAQILRLMKSLIENLGTAVLFISHDLAVVAQMADRVAVMYAGMVVEEAPVNDMFETPLHPYTQALLASLPKDEAKNKHLGTIPGAVPSLTNIPSGCPFHPRCKYAMEECPRARPELREVSPDHKVACVLY
jgi:oligopeptide/dipeptide ABC transporter ATP-binding protein